MHVMHPLKQPLASSNKEEEQHILDTTPKARKENHNPRSPDP